jgi:hypothetical protein
MSKKKIIKARLNGDEKLAKILEVEEKYGIGSTKF